MKDRLKAVATHAPDWQANLAAHTGQWAFVLTLSKRMVFLLTHIRDNSWHREMPKTTWGGHFIPSVRTLIDRGLVKWNEARKDRRGIYQDDGTHRWYVLTPAGELVCKLLVLAGQMPEEPK